VGFFNNERQRALRRCSFNGPKHELMLGKDKMGSHDSFTRWTKDVDFFKLDTILIPISKNQLHWIAVKALALQKSTELHDS
jgi:hypothetical protein